MSDIFLSHAVGDREKAAKLAAFFEQQCWTVWQEATWITAGDVESMAKEFVGAKVVVMLLSSTGGKSFSMRTVFENMGLVPIVPVMLERVRMPFEFSLLRIFDLSDWDGSELHLELQYLLRRLRNIIGPSSVPDKPPVSLEELSLSEIQERANIGIKESAAALTKDDARFGGVFISYRRNEAAAYARGLYDRLAAHFGGEKIFLDLKNVSLGEDFVEAITTAAESCAVMIALISPRWSRGAGTQAELDDYVRLEVSKALGRKIRVIPILIQGASMPAPKDLPEDLSPLIRRNALALSDDARWERDVEDLIKSLEGLLKD